MSPSNLALCADNRFTESDVLDTEKLVLKTLEYKLAFPTILDFCWEFARQLPSLEGTEWRMIRYASELALQTPAYVVYRPSLIAASIVVLSRRVVDHATQPLWPEALADATGYRLSHLQDCVNVLCRQMAHIRATMPHLIMISRIQHEMARLTIPRSIDLLGD